MTTIVSGTTAPAAVPEKKAPRSLESVGVMPDKGFAGMLGRMEAASPLTFRRPKGGPGATVSFDAMPLVAPASVAAAGPADREGGSDPMPAIPANAVPATMPGVAGDIAPTGQQLHQHSATAIVVPASHGAGFGNGAAIRAAITLLGSIMPTQPASLPTPLRGAARDPIGGVTSPKRVEVPHAPASAAFDLGGGVAVYLAGEAANPRVLVRGARIDAEGRGEVVVRIVKLMRSHGFAVSEQAIEFEGGRSE